MEDLIARGQAQQAGAHGFLVNAHEAERIIQQLKELDVEQVGSKQWLDQHQSMEKLNLQAHHNAQTHSDEFVMETLISFDKLTTVVQNLLVIEVWKENLYPILEEHLANKVDTVTSYILMFNEGAIANLLEVTLFHLHACEAVSEDALLELSDWCYRKLHFLNVEGERLAQPTPSPSMKQLLEKKPLEELREKRDEMKFNTALAALTILRYLTDHITELPLSLLHRLTKTNDIIMALLPLLDKPPWSRYNKGKVEKYINNKWTVVEPGDRFRLTQHDAQAWLALYNLVVEPKCRAKYELDDFRKNSLLKLRRHMNEVLFDQLPVLKDLQRLLDEISLQIGTPPVNGVHFMLEQVPEIREMLMRGKNWPAIAEDQKAVYFKQGNSVSKSHMESLLQAMEFLCDLEEPFKKKKDVNGNSVTDDRIRLSCWRQTSTSSVMEAWWDLDLEIDTSQAPDNITLTGSNSSLPGLRYRLKAMPLQETRALPTNGKVVVVHGGRTAEALLSLPEVPVRSAASNDAHNLWLTIGLLAQDGLVLQLKVKRADAESMREKVDGSWYAYHPVGGALTLLPEEAQNKK